jgi:Protein of unknown function C-terminus (DUF2399)
MAHLARGLGVAVVLAVRDGESAVRVRRDRPGSTPWDPNLHSTMVAKGIAIYEEALLERLIRDVAEHR